MKECQELMQEMKNSSVMKEKINLVLVMMTIIKEKKSKIKAVQKQQLFDFAISELKPLANAIEDAKDYKEKDLIFCYIDKLLAITMFSGCSSEECAVFMMSLLEVVNKHRVLENKVDEMFMNERITKNDLHEMLNVMNKTEDVFEKGKLFSSLLYFEDKFDRFDDDAKEILIKFLNKETLEYILGFDKNCEDKVFNLVNLCSVLGKLFNKDTVRILKIAEKVDYPAVKYYSANSLLELDEEPAEETIEFLANHDVYSFPIFQSLKRNGLIERFPKELQKKELLAKSDLIHWLCFPTELNEKPNEIEFVGILRKHKKEYFVFKFKSDSDNLDDENKNVWLVGWSTLGEETFSDFEKFSDFERETIEKTLKSIKKRVF